MERCYIKNLKAGKCLVKGYIEKIRDQKTMQFVVLRDVTGAVQITIIKNEKPELAEIVSKLTVHSFIDVEGECVNAPQVKLGGLEVLPTKIVVHSVADMIPIAEDSSPDIRMDYRWIDLRNEKNQLIFKVQTCLIDEMRKFLLKENFIEIRTPKLIAAASESGADVFEVKYFDRKAYLAQSPQFYKQMAQAAGFERIFEQGPVFRAEKSFTNRHVTEFGGFDLEFSYIDSFHDVMKLEEDLIIAALTEIEKKYGKQIKELYGIDTIVPKKPFPVIPIKELYDILEKEYGYKIPESEKGDMTTEAEKLSYEYVKKKYNHEFLFVTDFDAKKRAFYHMRDKNGVPQGYDLIWRGVEITTGAQREHRYDVLLKQAKEKKLDNDVRFYLDFFKYGCPPHGGFGVGVDRFTMLIFGLPIRDVTFIPRTPSRLTP